jgi:hypothetical protein
LLELGSTLLGPPKDAPLRRQVCESACDDGRAGLCCDRQHHALAAGSDMHMRRRVVEEVDLGYETASPRNDGHVLALYSLFVGRGIVVEERWLCQDTQSRSDLQLGG